MSTRTGKLCVRCESLPLLLEGAGQLYLWFPLGPSFNKVVNFFLRRAGETCQLLGDRQCRLAVEDQADLEQLTLGISELLSGEELKDTRALFVAGREVEPVFADFARITSLKQFNSFTHSGWLLEMMAGERFTSHFQPIVHAADTARLFGHEALLRGIDPDGALVSPGRILDTCRDADLLFQIDLLARRVAVREAGRHDLTEHVFINFNPTAIYDPTFCLRSTVRAIDEAGLRPEQIVFEVTEADRSADADHLKRILTYYREAGFGVALDDLGAGYSSLNLVHQLRPDYIKLDMDLIRGVNHDECKAVIAAKLLEIALELGIKTVAEGIETMEELDWVRAHGADFVQGYLIGRPAATPLLNPPSLCAAPAWAGASTSQPDHAHASWPLVEEEATQ